MSDTVIKVEGLSKSYIISHKTSERYVALRDVIADKFKAFGRNYLGARRRHPASSSEEQFFALKDVSFEIKRGDRVGIIGRNGAGKSTLLKVLSRITEPTTGRIEIKGRVASLLEVGTGFHPELTGRENIFLNGAILGMTKAEIKRKFDEIVDFAEIEKFLDTPVKRYSSGMYVRLAFAVAAHLEPEILIVDEVLAVGDAQFQKKCLGKMEEVGKEGRTVLFVSHNMGTVLQLCNNCILLKTGEIELLGDSNNVIDHYYNNSAVTYLGKDNENKDIYLKSIETYGKDGPQSSFAHSEPIILRLTIGINKFYSFQNIGLALLTRGKNRVFTVNKSIENFADANTKELTVDFIIEGELIAPMDYSFLVALNTRTGTITYDWVSDICPIKVYDDGTELSFAEGYDYGCIILKDKWHLINKT